MFQKKPFLELLRQHAITAGWIFLFILLVISVSLRNQDFRKVAGAANLEATYHVLLTAKALKASPIENHWGLPTVSLGTDRDKNIPWGSTAPTKTGDFIYTSFSAPGFMAPYLLFELFDVKLSEKNLARFNALIGCLVSLILYALLAGILRSAGYSSQVAAAGALVGAAVSVFSREALQSHGVVYWVHSFYQLILVCCLYLVFSFLSNEAAQDGIRKRIGAWLVAAVFLGAWTEWTGYVFGIGLAALFWPRRANARSSRALSTKLILAVAAAGLVTLIHLSLGVGFEPAVEALLARFIARNTSSGSLVSLLAGYALSFGVFLLIVVGALSAFFFRLTATQREDVSAQERIGLVFLAATIPLVENLLMLQHAEQFSFDRLKLIFPLAILISYAFARSVTTGRAILIFAICLASVHGYNSYKADLARYSSWTQVDLRNKSLARIISQATDTKCAAFSSNIGVRGYTNNLLDRGVFEYKSKDESWKLMAKTQACSAVYLEGDWVYTDLPRYKKAYLTRTDGTVVSFELLDLGPIDSGFFLTDANWEHGIAKNWAGFFVPDTDVLRAQLGLGTEVILANGEVRKVLRTEAFAPYLNVYLDGPIMNFQRAGAPEAFIVRRPLGSFGN